MRYTVVPTTVSALDVIDDRNGGRELTPIQEEFGKAGDKTPATIRQKDDPTVAYKYRDGANWTIPLCREFGPSPLGWTDLVGNDNDWSDIAVTVLGSSRGSDTPELASLIRERRKACGR